MRWRNLGEKGPFVLVGHSYGGPGIRNFALTYPRDVGEYFGKWMKTSPAGTLGAIPLVVLTRAEGGYGNDQDVPAAQLDRERKEGQAMLVKLSPNCRQVVVKSGHNMNLEAPEDVTSAIRMAVEAVRKGGKL
jgi:hypothetical protein